MTCLNAESRIALSEFPRVVSGLDLGAAGEAELKAVLRQVRAAQRCLEGIAMRIGARSNVLAARGKAAPAAETLRGDGAVGASQARREARRAEVAHAVPGVIDAVADGEISGEHVDAIARHSGRLSNEQQAGFDFDAVVVQAKRLPPETFNRFMKRAVEQAKADHGLGDTIAKRAASEFRHWFDHATGMGRFSGSLDPERYELLVAAVEQRCSSMAAAGDVEKNHTLAAAALVELVTSAEVGRDVRGRLPSILVVVDHETASKGPHAESVRQTENGHDIAAASVARLACDAVLRRVVLDESGVPIDVGRKHRTATDGQWAALKAQYSSCAWDGCTAPISWCQAHHIREWERGGATDYENLVPLCSQHHHRVHEGGWSIKLKPDRTLEAFKPGGCHHSTTSVPMRC
ncbi:MAG: HNH endonuclease [Acidimicrobiales bacterium]